MDLMRRIGVGTVLGVGFLLSYAEALEPELIAARSKTRSPE